ncbi:hypothetical protein [Actinomadura nitritigenes]|uniref:hypothetical protein n=1 Tax=Actinomadura nitritigenes TaxID=134602 RepID=UPI003D9176FA
MIDAAEAWRRARLRLPEGNDESALLIRIQEFEDGYLAVPVRVAIPEPPPIPTAETPTGLVVDKSTGVVTRWPLLPLPVLARQYRFYQNRRPMTFDDA